MNDDSDLRDFDGICRLFPLGGVVLFPHAVLPLHIFEPRYRQMTEEALKTDGLIAIVQPVSQIESLDSEPALESVACLGRIIKHLRLADGRFNFLLQGLKRVRILEELSVSTLYRQARVEIMEETRGERTLEFQRQELIGLYRAITLQIGGMSPEVDAVLDGDMPLAVITDLMAQSLGLPASMKQIFLNEHDVPRRVAGLVSVFRQISDSLGLGALGPNPSRPPFSDN